MTSFRNPVITDQQGADHGDPFVLKYRDTYYLYHTGRHAISVYTSRDLVHWEYEGKALEAAGPDHWAQVDLWAPEVMFGDGIFYMYVAATPYGPDGRGDDQARRQGIARATSPLGPFTWDERPLVSWEWSIDGHPFKDTDGQTWFFYNIRTDATRYKDGTVGCGNVVDRLVAPDRLEGQSAPVAFPSERWEGNRDGTWYWNEGPAVLKRRGNYYQMYSGGCYADDTYGVGFATAPAPRGPWTKYPGNPILRTGTQILGPGHHCVVRAPDGVTPYVVYHGYVPGEKGRKNHIDRLFWAGDRLIIAGPTAEEQPLPPGPVYDPAVPHWHLDAWVRGTAVMVCGIRLDVPLRGEHRVEAIKSGEELWVLVDGVLRHSGAAGSSKPDLDVAGALLHLTRTSWLDDENIYSLAAGESHTWEWGGGGPVEVILSVRGQAVIQAGAREIAVTASPDRYELVPMLVTGGAERLVVQAGPGGATVTDVTMTARV